MPFYTASLHPLISLALHRNDLLLVGLKPTLRLTQSDLSVRIFLRHKSNEQRAVRRAARRAVNKNSQRL